MRQESRPVAEQTSTGGDASAPSRVMIDVASVLLEFQASGRLVPWLGPAVRGVVAAAIPGERCLT